jgi:hypothetical protein
MHCLGTALLSQGAHIQAFFDNSQHFEKPGTPKKKANKWFICQNQ